MNLYNELWGLWRVIAEMLFVPRPTFSADQIPDLSGQVILVTGKVKQDRFQVIMTSHKQRRRKRRHWKGDYQSE